VDDRPIFGIQFHPERNIESAKRSLSHLEPENRAKALLKEGDNHSLFNQKVGDTIFGNFFSIR
jgi:hypothetical protein